jgi:hypothetical protein
MGKVSRGPWFCLALRQAKQCFLQRRVMRLLRAKRSPPENRSYAVKPWLWARQLRPATWLLEAEQSLLARTSL